MQTSSIRGAQSSSFTIPANDRVQVQGHGEFVRCLSSTAAFQISINGGSPFYFAAGIQWRASGLEHFEQFDLVNPTGTPITVIMAWGFGEVSDSRLSVVSTISILDVGSTLVTYADVSVNATAKTLVLAANANRREAIITNQGPVAVRLGDTNIGAARGPFIPPGGTATISNKADIYVYNPSGAAISIGVGENIT